MTCHDIYRDALRSRADTPLSQGGYKRDEFVAKLIRMRDTLGVIDQRVRTSGKFEPDENLGSCMADERARWMKALPAAISRELGYNLVPALRLLRSDLAQIDRKASALIDECEAVRVWLSGGIAREYDEMRQGASRLHALIASALAIAERHEGTLVD